MNAQPKFVATRLSQMQFEPTLQVRTGSSKMQVSTWHVNAILNFHANECMEVSVYHKASFVQPLGE
jgi:hypothetical protein